MNLLAPFGIIYGRVMDARNALYDRGTFKSFPLGLRTISVGNLTTGGTGKTPLVAYIAQILIEHGEKPCILTRGYGRKNTKERVLVCDGKNVLVDAKTGGDEPVELAHKLNGEVVIVADRDRVAAAKWAISEFEITVFILDDGFQHRRAQRDLDIVCIDATNPCGNGRLLPAGTLRESFKGLTRAGAIVITRSDQVDDVKTLYEKLKAQTDRTPIFHARTALKGLVELEEFHSASHIITGPKKLLFAFTGLGSPEQFFDLLKKNGVSLAGTQNFPDHHRFTQVDITALEIRAKEDGADGLVTTAKDGVKLKSLKFELPCHVAIVDTVIDEAAAFRDLIVS